MGVSNPSRSPRAEYTETEDVRPKLNEGRLPASSPTRVRTERTPDPLDNDLNTVAEELGQKDNIDKQLSKEIDVSRSKRRKPIIVLTLETAGRERIRAFGDSSYSQTSAFLPESITTQRGKSAHSGTRYAGLPRRPSGRWIRPAREVSHSVGFSYLYGRKHRRKSANGPAYEEICIPSRMTTWGAEFGALSPRHRPVQDIQHAIYLDPACGKHAEPSCAPGAVARIREKPRTPHTAAHDRDIENWIIAAESYKRDGAGIFLTCLGSLRHAATFRRRHRRNASDRRAATCPTRDARGNPNPATVENATMALEYNRQVHIYRRGAA